MIGNDWDDILKEEFKKDYFKKLMKFVKKEYQTKAIMPKQENLFKALKITNYKDLKIVIIGQDPYPTKGVADGLAFSTNDEIATPKSLVNIKKLLEKDLTIKKRTNNLESWSKQGILLLNRVLTVEEGKANSHQNNGWERFTEEIIRKINKKEQIIFVLLGKQAQQVLKMIDKRHVVIITSHPSPLSAHRGFMTSNLFSRINKIIKIEW